MMKKTLMAAAISASVFAAGVQADWAQTTTAGNTYAAEMFGSGDVTLAAVGDVVLTADATGIAAGQQATLTITLSNGATFATAAPVSLVFDDNAGNGTLPTNTKLTGAMGDSSASYGLTVGVDFVGTETLTFVMPDINATLADGTEIMATVTIEQVGTPDPFLPFHNTVTIGADETDVVAEGVTSVAAPVLVTDAVDADVKSELREEFDDGFGDPSSTSIGRLGTVGLTEVAGANDETGASDFAVGNTDTFTLTISGNFSAFGEALSTCLDLGDGAAGGANKACEAGADIIGVVALDMASATYTLADATDLVGVTADVLVTADGETDIAISDYSATGVLDFTNVNFVDLASGPDALNSTSFAGLTRAGIALVVTNATSNDPTFIRVTNTSGLAVDLFAQLTTQNGDARDLVELADVAANSTEVFTSAEIEALLGGTFSGRANVEFLSSSTDTLEILNLVRTSDVLTNLNK